METITSRIDSVTKIPATHLREICPPPKAVKIELTNRCNYACAYCGLRGRETPGKDEIDFGKFQDWTRQMKMAGVEEIGLFYIGESTMSPKLLLDCLKHCKRIGFEYVFLTTNGSLLNPMLAGELMANGLDSLKFSINAATPEQFKDVMGVKPKLFEAALANLKSARETRDANGYGTRIYASSIKLDGEQQAAMEELLKARVLPYVDEHYWLPLFSEMQSPLAAKNEARGWKPNAGNQGRLDALRDPLPCWAVFTEGHLRVDGGLSACCFGADDRFDMGNLNDMSFVEAWNSPKFQALRKKHLSGDVHGSPCEECIHGTKEVKFV